MGFTGTASSKLQGIKTSLVGVDRDSFERVSRELGGLGGG